VPEHRTMLSFNYQTDGMFGGYLRLNRFGEWKSTGGLFSPGDASDVATYDSEILVDAEVSLNFAERFRFTLGGENIFDVEPDNEQDFVLGILGVSKAITSPFGFNGGFWYARLMAEF
jgi:iron complex outermembrane receptor protein